MRTQAFAYIIDRDENGKVTYGDATKGVKLMAGMPDEIVDRWLTPEAKAKLNPYAKDWNKAAELLTKAGLKKGADGIWTDAAGKKWEVEVSAPADWADVLASAQNAVDQLKKFGIAASVRGYQSADRTKMRTEGKYQILMEFGMLYNVPHPYRGYEFALTPPSNDTDNKAGPGMGWPMTQKGPDGKDYKILNLIRQSNLGFDQAKQKEPISILSQIVNDQLPYFAFWVRRAMDPTNINNVQGWLPQTDKVYQNAQGGDNYAAIQFLAGTLKPTAANKAKIFQTGWRYTQPGKFHLNNFTTGSLQGMGGFILPAQYPPLFFYMWADNKYVPVMAEKFELVQK